MMKPVITLLFLATTILGASIPKPTPQPASRILGGYKPQRKVDGFAYAHDVRAKRDTTPENVSPADSDDSIIPGNIDATTATTCQQCSQVYQDCRGRCHTDGNGQDCGIVCMSIACDAFVNGDYCHKTCLWTDC